MSNLNESTETRVSKIWVVDKEDNRELIVATDENIKNCIEKGLCRGRSWGTSTAFSDYDEYQHLFSDQSKTKYLSLVS